MMHACEMEMQNHKLMEQSDPVEKQIVCELGKEVSIKLDAPVQHIAFLN